MEVIILFPRILYSPAATMHHMVKMGNNSRFLELASYTIRITHHLSLAAVFGHIENQDRSLLVSRTSYQGIHHPDVALFDLHGFRCPNQMPRLTPIQINRHV